MLSPCYSTQEEALNQAALVIRSWSTGEPENVSLLRLHEDTPFLFALVTYRAPQRPTGPVRSWLGALVLNKQPCGWLWVAASVSAGDDLLDSPDGFVAYRLSVNRDWRFWIAIGRCKDEVVEVQCTFLDGQAVSAEPAQHFFLIGGTLRGPLELRVLTNDRDTLEVIPLPRSFHYVYPPLDGPPQGDFEVEMQGHDDVSAGG